MALIHIADQPHEPIEAGRHRILDAALKAGFPFPHGCSSGECGGCKCALLDGKVDMEAYSPDALSDEERAGGLILACRARMGGVQHQPHVMVIGKGAQMGQRREGIVPVPLGADGLVLDGQP